MYYNNETELFLDGKFLKAKDATTSVYGQTVHYGNGVFEGIRSYSTSAGTKIFKAKEHFDRLHYSAEKMHIKLDYTAKQLEDFTYEVLKRNNLSDAYIRPLVYLGDNMGLTPTDKVHVVIMAWDWGKYLGDQLQRVKISSYQRPNKHSCHIQAKVVGHYINSILATTEAKQAGFDEALLKDSDGFIAEGPGANLFMEKGGKLYTPALGNILSGITRKTIIDLAKQNGVVCEEKQLTDEDLKSADSAFFCGTAAEVVGLRSVDDYEFPASWENSLGKKMQQLYKDEVLKP